MLGAQSDEELLGAELQGCDFVWSADAAAGDRDVDPAGGQLRDEVREPHPVYLDGHQGRVGGEAIDQVWGQHWRDWRGYPEAHRAGLCLRDQSDGVFGDVDFAEDLSGALEELGAGGGEVDPAGAADEQRCPELRLQSADQIAERRRAQVELFGSMPEVQFGRDRHERAQLA